eukprot:jgi/Undpi1/6469/HiC_scaffold_20.g08948.m1
MNHSAKRQRALDDQGMAATAPSKEHATSSLRGRQEPRGAGGDLRLDVASSLNRTETDILGMMVEAAKLSKRNTVVRVAGGWVRDKLLGLENDDIDVALDDCTGVVFANVVNFYLTSSGRDEGKVAANPEQSKHLQTARMNIRGVWVDLVNLRTETYSSDSRIPEASFGTAEEDALRRDFTLNALFFNVNDGKVEDMTGRGINDLRQGIIRTPLPPMITFQDDPLRLMRAVRFAARFDFALHEDLRAAARDSKIQAALGNKVSRERIGAELSGMLTGKRAQPALALSLLEELGLTTAIYNPPPNPIPPAPERGYDWARGAAVARAASRVLGFRAKTSVTATGKGVKVGAIEEPRRQASMSSATTATAAAPSDGTSVAEGKGAIPDVVGEVEVRVKGVEAEVGVVGGNEPDAPVSAAAAGENDSMSVKVIEGKGGAGTGTGAASGDKGRVSQKAEGVSCGGKETGGDPETLVRELFLCSALLPLSGVKHKAKKGKLAAAAQFVVQESLKLKSKEAKNVADILELAPTFRKLADAYAATPNAAGALETEDGGAAEAVDGASFSRLAVGLAVRQARELWPTCVTLCCAVEMCDAREGGAALTRPTSKDGSVSAAAPPAQAAGSVAIASAASAGKRARRNKDEDEGNAEQGVGSEQGGENGSESAIIEKYIGFEKAVATMGLRRAWEIAPLVRGEELMVELQVPRGPEVGKLMAKQVSWQLEHPEGTREQCVACLRAAL